MATGELQARIGRLEIQIRRLRVSVGLLLLGALVVVVTGAIARSEPDVLKARVLIIVDEDGRERVVIGAPIPEPEGRRIAAVSGMVINDDQGAERFGLGLSDTGAIVMGFDAPPGTGDDRNRERITLGVGPTGGADFRFLNRRTQVAAHMSLFGDENVRLFFTDYRDDGTVVHRISADGDTVVFHER